MNASLMGSEVHGFVPGGARQFPDFRGALQEAGRTILTALGSALAIVVGVVMIAISAVAMAAAAVVGVALGAMCLVAPVLLVATVVQMAATLLTLMS